jgi:hypothetical protein
MSEVTGVFTEQSVLGTRSGLLEIRFLVTLDSAILDRELRRHLSCPSCPYSYCVKLGWSEDPGMKEPAHHH